MAKRKHLTERAAWLMLAEKWDGATPGIDGSHRVRIAGWNPSCVCVCITAMDSVGHFTTHVSNLMRARMERHTPTGHHGVFWWPRDAAGARKRAAFCRRMAKLCVQKPKARPGGKRSK